MTKPRPRILFADDHELVLAGISSILREHFAQVEGVTSPIQLLTRAERSKPDIILLDISMPGMDGLEAARKLRTIAPESRVIFLTVHDEHVYVEAALEAGAHGYVLKRSSPEELVRAIEEVYGGRHYLSPAIRTGAAAGASATADDPLTTRQKEVLKLVASGLSTKQIAANLFITTKAVDFHKGRIRQALGLHSTAELTRYAITHGLADL